MSASTNGLPTIIVPYIGAAKDQFSQDIFMFLRPETNGVMAESAILKVIKSANSSHKYLNLVFLANLPGGMIVDNHVVEQFYALKLHFSVMGKSAFTENMKQKFTKWFKTPFEEADIIGSFIAVDEMKIQPEELFATWVPDQDVTVILGQSIKKIGNRFIVNYDIPALLHKNSKNTDIAVMAFRCSVSYDHVKQLVQEMHEALCINGILNIKYDAGRAFHYSKGPFEQIRDGIIYVSADSRHNLKLKDFTYAAWLMERGVDGKDICSLLMNPLVQIRHPNGSVSEEHFLQYTQFDDYETGLEKYNSIVRRIEMIHHSPLIKNMNDLLD